MYKLLGRKQLRRPSEIIQPGEEFEPTEAELRSFGDKLAKVETSEPAHDDVEVPDEKEDEDEDAPDYENMSYDELRQLAADADTDEINGRSSKEDIVNYFA